jgi:hypothetical protein
MTFTSQYSTAIAEVPAGAQAEDADRAFLELFPTAERNALAQFFHQRVRGGAATPLSVTIRVAAHIGARLDQVWGDGVERRLQAYLDALVDHFDLALRYAQSALTWEALPAEQRARIKEGRNETFRREYMAGQPPTDKQVNYLAKLGWTGTVPESKAAASDLIDRLQAGGGR